MSANTTEILDLNAAVASRSGVVAPAVLAILLGALLVFGTGLVHIPAVHNAAHDTRHALAFPCH